MSKPYVLISSDCHAGADIFEYKAYLASSWHEAFDEWAAAFHDPWATFGFENSDEDALKVGTASFLNTANWDSARRVRDLEGDGIVAEVLFPNTVPPFQPSGSITSPGPRTPQEYTARWAGLQAHNRWLADFCGELPGRRAGLAQVLLLDLDDAVAEVRWARANGLSGVLLPPDHILQMNSLYYPHLDALWAVCEELDMPVHRHGILAAEASTLDEDDPSPAIAAYESWFYSQRGLAHMLLSGAFDRFPRLKFVISEGQSAWVPRVVRGLDSFVARAASKDTIINVLASKPMAKLRRKPSEYFATNCYLGTFFTPDDIDTRHAVGVDRLMWGADYPHEEGTVPYTREVLRVNFADVPEDEVRQMTSGTAAAVYGFDLEMLERVAERVGAPTPEEVQTPVSADEIPQRTLCPSLTDSFQRTKRDRERISL